MEQISFLPRVDEDVTWANVERALNECLLYERIGFHPDHQPKVSHQLVEVPSWGSGGFHSSTEDCTQKNVDTEMYRKQHVDKVRKAVKRLSRREREVIEKRYLEDPDMSDYEAFTDLHMSERTYYRIKHRAIYILAFALNVEVLREMEDKKNPSVKIVGYASDICWWRGCIGQISPILDVYKPTGFLKIKVEIPRHEVVPDGYEPWLVEGWIPSEFVEYV